MVSNEAERSPKLELEKLSSSREGWNATRELSHAWEKAQCTGGEPVGVGSGGAGTAEPGGQLADWTRFRHQAK